MVVGDVRAEPREGGAPTVELIAAAGGSAEFVQADVGQLADDNDLLVAHRGRRAPAGST